MTQAHAKAFLQEDEYSIPYHYLATRNDLIAFPNKLLIAPAYLLYLQRVMSLAVASENSTSVLDAGCGDGRLIWEMRRHGFPAKLRGIDYSERAIQFARLFNPGITFDVADLTDRSSLPVEEFDTVISMETLEHIAPERVTIAIKNMASLIKKNGSLVLTVPHTNRPLDHKHYQHFDSSSLRRALSEEFSHIELIGFYKQSVSRFAFGAIVAAYYFLYPLRRIGLHTAMDRFSGLGFRFFERYLLECGPDDGNSLIAICRKS